MLSLNHNIHMNPSPRPGRLLPKASPRPRSETTNWIAAPSSSALTRIRPGSPS